MKETVISLSKMADRDFEGWGTSLCWWANRVGFSEKLTEKSAALFFSRDGLGLSIMRYNIGGGDDPSHRHITRTDSDMPGWLTWNPTTGKREFDPEADKNQLRVLVAACQAAGSDAYVEAFSNSPPYFMTVSGCSSGHKNPRVTNIKKSCAADFARYLADVVEYLRERMDIPVKSLACMNEPFTPYWHAYSEKQEGCHVSPGKMQSLLLCETAAAIKAKGLDDIEITATDETNSQLQLIALRRLTQEAKAVIGRVSTHTYDKATPKLRPYTDRMGLQLWMTETDWSNISGEDPGEMGAGLWLGEKIIEDLTVLSPCAWVIWQVMAGYISRREHQGRRDPEAIPDLKGGYWGTAFGDIDNEEIILTQKYYAFGQFTRYIRPGMRLIPLDSHCIAAVDRQNKRLVIVALNTKAQKQERRFTFSDSIPQSPVTGSRTCGTMADGEHWRKLPPVAFDQNSFAVTLAPNSISSFEVAYQVE